MLQTRDNKICLNSKHNEARQSASVKKQINMKVVLIALGVVAVAIVLVQLFAMRTQHDIETYPYTVVKTFDAFEIRRYEASLFTSVQLSTNEYEQASNKGFSILAGYIFGGNKTGEKIAMTSPVTMSLEDSMTVMFMVPKAFKKENLPEPNQPQIAFREEPAKTVAAIRFGGWANSQKIEQYKQQLTAALDTAGIPYHNRFYFFGYNPPFEIFNRRNEVIVELENYDAGGTTP